MTPEISLVVATIGRVESLRRLLDSLVEQPTGDTEIIVVNQEDRDGGTHRCLQAFENRLNLIHIRDDKRGLSHARNLGLKQARGRIVGFPDDDCWYGRDVLNMVRKQFSKNDKLGLLCGIYSEPNVVNENFPKSSSALNKRNVFGRACSVGLFIQRDCVDSRQLYFDEAVGAGTSLPAGEEVDLVLRLLAAGASGQYVPSLVVFHKILRNIDNPDLLLGQKQAFWYVVGKNYPLVESRMRLVRGLAGLVFRPSPLPLTKSVRSILAAYKLGCARRQIVGLRST